MCEVCDEVKLVDHFSDPQQYLQCIEYIKELLSSGDFVLVEKSCDINKVKTESGKWDGDVISHVIECKNCGQCYSCSVVTFRGSGSFKKGR